MSIELVLVIGSDVHVVGLIPKFDSAGITLRLIGEGLGSVPNRAVNVVGFTFPLFRAGIEAHAASVLVIVARLLPIPHKTIALRYKVQPNGSVLIEIGEVLNIGFGAV